MERRGLVDEEAIFARETSDKQRVFLHAIENNDINTVVFMLVSNTSLLESKTPSGLSPLLLAASKGYEKMFFLLEGAGAKIQNDEQKQIIVYCKQFNMHRLLLSLRLR